LRYSGISRTKVPLPAAQDPDPALPVVDRSVGVAAEDPAASYSHGGQPHLQSLVDEALTAYLGRPAEHDEDGDAPVMAGDAVVFVRVLSDTPLIQLFSCVAHDVEDLTRAAFEVGVLNRDVQLLKFVLVGDMVMAYLHLPAWPFAPEHLRGMLAIMTEAVAKAEGDLAIRLGGADALEDSAGEDSHNTAPPLHPAMLTLLQLDTDSPGSVDPALAAGHL
jgi:hypothetical protein